MSDQPTPTDGAKPQETTEPTTSTSPHGATTESAKDTGAKPQTDWEKHARTWEDRARANKQQLDQMQQQWDKLSSIFAPQGDGEASKPEDMIKALSDRIEQSEDRAAIADLARRHGITRDDDIALLSAGEKSQRETLAARLKGQSIPPDPGQGARPSAASSDDAEYETFYPPTRK